ncbi:ATPase, YjeE family [Halobacteroides halobius DSM 5150]|uniref:tRNA threonylcarbamoyladenosine biosynthesis protein TsaE n=1 Tax=Halobacteroides halobius (strain ATCC 35273 / DSM 5150 / MD-1) TaxID=748449 RepID=L0K710_HALHC|nr:tRNA (adenosine(37)-N6)-threonylcarbamoyltransferase complex ATPase subunit type 1 TsaE [Halobacteroides halobius]AGB40305.1 ATPase, YjeE family [Halobacteroides halobius DSM 5150]
MLKVKTDNPEETFKLGKKIGNKLNPGDIVCLQGSLGAGKTSLAKGICAGLGVKDKITSPTYTIVNEYQGRMKVNHMDLYRIKAEEELYDLGFEEYIYGSGVTIIEWPDKAGSLIPDNYLDINLHGEGNYREIRLIPQANKFIELVSELEDNVSIRN